MIDLMGSVRLALSLIHREGLPHFKLLHHLNRGVLLGIVLNFVDLHLELF